MSTRPPKRLKRPLHRMPAFVRDALIQHHLMDAYRRRPPYQRNDYVGWIASAKLEPTREKHLAQMLVELEDGNRYMSMPYRSR